MGKRYESQILVRFADCDPAQMVFYPRYLTMFNDLVEDWFREELKLPFSYYHFEQQHGLPTVHLEVDFVAPSRLGDVLTATLTVNKVGRSSIGLDIVLRGADQADRVRGKVVLVVTDLRNNRAVPIPDDLRRKIMEFGGDSEFTTEGHRGTEMKIVQPPNWPRPKGYSNGIVARGEMVFVAGMVGWDEHGKFVGAGILPQAKQALKNVVAVLKEAGALPEHIVRMNWYVADKWEYMEARSELGQAYREIVGNHYPAMTAVQVAGLVEEGARVEIEVTAVIPE